MVVISCLAFMAVASWVGYWLGRARRLNHAIKTQPERVIVNADTGEVIEPDTEAWNAAMRSGKVVTFL